MSAIDSTRTVRTRQVATSKSGKWYSVKLVATRAAQRCLKTMLLYGSLMSKRAQAWLQNPVTSEPGRQSVNIARLIALRYVLTPQKAIGEIEVANLNRLDGDDLDKPVFFASSVSVSTRGFGSESRSQRYDCGSCWAGLAPISGRLPCLFQTARHATGASGSDHHVYINIRHSLAGPCYASEFEKKGRAINIRVNGHLQRTVASTW